ncbi:TPA: hypothetical protein HA251_08355 [Candidatus Woesearchaeota archaeon]|nr:hypothetical protein [Candidatus Woesearchaeota archaeon]
MDAKQFPVVYFACSGNTCRSPMAERIMEEYVKKLALPIVVASSRASLSAHVSGEEDPISMGAAAILWERFQDQEFITRHRAQNFDLDSLAEASLVATMTDDHVLALENNPASYTDDRRLKVRMLSELAGEGRKSVSDPYGSDDSLLLDTYKLEKGIPKKSYAKPSSSAISEHFGEHREWQLRAQAYTPTFDQLERLIGKMIARDIYLPTIQEVFTGRIDDAFNDHKTRSNKTSFGTMSAQRSIIERFNDHASAMTGFVQMCDDTINAYVRAVKDDPAALALAEEFEATLERRVYPDLLFYGKYTGPDLAIDYAAIGEDIGAHIEAPLGSILPQVTSAPLSQAVQYKVFGEKLFRLGTKVYPGKEVARMHHVLTV